VFGLGNAATAFGIKAMEELQKAETRSTDTCDQRDGDVPRDQHARAFSS
jgi:spore maturation protein SpmA